jgi:hypothetical protein
MAFSPSMVGGTIRLSAIRGYNQRASMDGVKHRELRHSLAAADQAEGSAETKRALREIEPREHSAA